MSSKDTTTANQSPEKDPDEDKKAKNARDDLLRKQMNALAREQRRVKIGSGKSNLVRDLVVFLGLVTGVLYFSYQAGMGELKDRKDGKDSSNRPVNELKKIPGANSMNSIVDSLSKLMLEGAEKSRRTEHCNIFISTSSIPNAQQSLFAGQAFESGQAVLKTQWFLPLLDDDDNNNENSNTTFVSSLAMMLKFHPTLANIDGQVIRNRPGGERHTNQEDFVFKAIRPIRPGDELILPYQSHPAYILQSHYSISRLFDHIPTLVDYNEADSIARDVAAQARQMQVVHGRQIQDAIRQLNTDWLYTVARDVAVRFRPTVAHLIPGSRDEYRKRRMDKEPSYLTRLQNVTLTHLQLLATCLGDVALPEEGNAPATGQRRFVQRAGVQAIPMYVVNSTNTCTVDSFPQDRCLSTPDSKVSLCPLTGFTFAEAQSSSEANIDISWFKRPNENSPASYTLEELQSLPPGSVSLLVSATKTIDVGEELLLAKTSRVAEKLIPKHWRIQ